MTSQLQSGILNKSSFIAKKAKTFHEEKEVADKAPIDSISINDLNSNATEKEHIKENKFNYSIKIADFYFILPSNDIIDIKK